MNISYAPGIVTAAPFDPFQFASCVVGASDTHTVSASPPVTTLWANMEPGDYPICMGNGIFGTASAANATATVITVTAGSTITIYGSPTVLPPADWLRAKESQNVQRITPQNSGANDLTISWGHVVLATLVTCSAVLL